VTDALATLIEAAVRAPSGDNTQPWRFALDPALPRVAIHLDPTRDPSPMNSGQRMARIALGAALENILRTAAGNGWTVRLEDDPAPALAALHLEHFNPGPVAVEPVLRQRVTNRRDYDGKPVAPEALAAAAAATPPLGGVTTHWITERQRLEGLADLVGRADAVMFGAPAMRHAFLHNVRFDAPPNAEVEEGLSLDSLELSASDRVALRLMRKMPQWLYRLFGAGKVFRAKAQQLVASASGLCLVVAPDDAEATDLTVGRAMQRAWLALTEKGLAVQPMSSLPVLDNALRHGTPEVIAAVGRDVVGALLEELRRLAPELGGGRLAFLMRFGHAPPPTGRTGRLAPQAVTTTGRESATPAAS
jgi:nitroreductase